MPIHENRILEPYSYDVIEAIKRFGRATHPLAVHFIPESEEDIQVGTRMTEGLIHLFNSSGLSEMASNYLSLAIEGMLREGEITEVQFLAIQHALESNLPIK